MMTVLTLPGLPESASAARELTARCLAGSPAADDAVLCVDELFANAVLHSASGLPGGKVTVIVNTAAPRPASTSSTRARCRPALSRLVASARAW